MLSGGQGDIRFVSTYRSFEDIRLVYDKKRRRDRQAGEISFPMSDYAALIEPTTPIFSL